MMTKPRFCPNPGCTCHHQENMPAGMKGPWYHKYGYYTCKVNGKVQRFICRSCGRQFSTQTFSLDYMVKKKIPYKRLFEQLNSGSGIRFLSRTFGVTDKVIVNRVSRLARQALGLNAKLRTCLSLTEDVAADGFESFTVSQYFPNNIHILVGKESQYLYGADYAHIRRKGRMREDQKGRRGELEMRFRPPRGEIRASFTRLIRHFLRYYENSARNGVCLFSDEKKEYQEVLNEVSTFPGKELTHIRISSRKARTVRNELFPVNYFDREIRKDQGNHVRETVEFSRNVNNCMERLWVYGVYHNYVKPYRVAEKIGKKTSHGEKAGLPVRSIRKEWKTFFTRRTFVSKLKLTDSEWRLWYRCYRTPLKQFAEYVPQYMCA